MITMGKRDYRRRESKKPKKEAKKRQIIPEIMPQADVEIVRKKPTIQE